MAQVKKISVKTVHGMISLERVLELAKESKLYPVMRVIGVAIGIKEGTSSYGDWSCLLGTFKATDAVSKKELRASQCFLPDVAMIPLTAALQQNNAKGVEFGIDLFVQRAVNPKPGGSPYEYCFEPIVLGGADDPIAALEKKLALAIENAASHEPEPEPEAEPKPEPELKPANSKSNRR